MLDSAKTGILKDTGRTDKIRIINSLIEVGLAFVEDDRPAQQGSEALEDVFFLMSEIMYDLYPSRKGGEAA